MLTAAPTPAEMVRELLAASRADGVPFEDAWAGALADLPEPGDGASTRELREHGEWLEALRATREAYGRAYDREPATRADRASGTLAAAVG